MYYIQPENIFIGLPIPAAGFKKDLLPEIKIRFNKSRYSLGKTTSSNEAADIFRRILGKQIETQEFMTVLFLNRSNDVIGFYRHTMGGTSGTILDVKMILGTATKLLASSLILAHNHPSGNLKPSDADTNITNKLREAAKYHDIHLLDHLILTKESYFSFADNGILGISRCHNRGRWSRIGTPGIGNINNCIY